MRACDSADNYTRTFEYNEVLMRSFVHVNMCIYMRVYVCVRVSMYV